MLRNLRLKVLKDEKANGIITADVKKTSHPFISDLRTFLYEKLSGFTHGSYPIVSNLNGYDKRELISLCSEYLLHSQLNISRAASNYIKYSQDEVFKEYITLELWVKFKFPEE